MNDAHPPTPLEHISAYFAAHCDGDWEHMNGIKIHTTDNPGWWVEIDLAGTKEDNLSVKFKDGGPESEISIETSGAQLIGYCYPLSRLSEMLAMMADMLPIPAPNPAGRD